MSVQHTPGPWQFGRFELYEGADPRFNISQAEGAKFTPNYSDVATTIAGERLGIQEANARLIAAAPELLDALRLAVRQNSHDMLLTGEEPRQCEAAIAKAEGSAS